METSSEKNHLKRQRISAFIIGILVLVSFISLVYAFVQQGIAQENARLAIENHKMAVFQREELIKCKQDLERQQVIAEKAAMEAKQQFQRAEEALKKISKK